MGRMVANERSRLRWSSGSVASRALRPVVDEESEKEDENVPAEGNQPSGKTGTEVTASTVTSRGANILHTDLIPDDGESIISCPSPVDAPLATGTEDIDNVSITSSMVSEGSSDFCIGERVLAPKAVLIPEVDADVIFYLGSLEGPVCACPWEVDLFDVISNEQGCDDAPHKIKFTAQASDDSLDNYEHSLIVSKNGMNSLKTKLVGLVVDVFHNMQRDNTAAHSDGKKPLIQIVVEKVALRFRYLTERLTSE